VKIAVGSDHAGFDLKEKVKGWLQEAGHEVSDCGPAVCESCDYPDFAATTAQAVATGQCILGVLVCGSGIGMSIAANKVDGIRAALCSEPVSAGLSRQHNDANILCIGSRMLGDEMAQAVLAAFLAGEFAGGRHQRRVEKIARLEKQDEKA